MNENGSVEEKASFIHSLRLKIAGLAIAAV